MNHILVVDEDIPTASFIVEALEYAGYVVHAEYDIPAALAAMAARLPDLILLDIRGPKDGISVLNLLRNGGAHNRPIILMSAGQPPTPEVLLQATCFLTKPFDLDELLQCVEQHMSKRTREQGGA